MASPLLQGGLAATVGRAFSSLFYECSISRSVPGDPDPQTPWIPGLPVVTDYPCKGMVDQYSDYAIANSLVNAEDKKVLILATSLAITPTDGDLLTIRGATYRITPPVKIDPALAVWELRCRI